MSHQAEYVAPKFGATAFHCPHCNVFAHQRWKTLWAGVPMGGHQLENFEAATCDRCNYHSIWSGKQLVFPVVAGGEPPNADMPDDVRRDFEEARQIVGTSPRGAVALLRLALQRLMPHLGEDAKNLDAAIGNLVKKGLTAQIQKACDVVRVVGNESVHPGQIDVNDTPEDAHALFSMINTIVQARITEPREIDEMFAALPKEKLKGIARRDGAPT